MDSTAKPDSCSPAKTLTLQVEPVLNKYEGNQEAMANEFAMHPDFAEARVDGLMWDSTSLDGIRQVHGL
jgi:hypothetical protein